MTTNLCVRDGGRGGGNRHHRRRHHRRVNDDRHREDHGQRPTGGRKRQLLHHDHQEEEFVDDLAIAGLYATAARIGGDETSSTDESNSESESSGESESDDSSSSEEDGEGEDAEGDPGEDDGGGPGEGNESEAAGEDGDCDDGDERMSGGGKTNDQIIVGTSEAGDKTEANVTPTATAPMENGDHDDDDEESDVDLSEALARMHHDSDGSDDGGGGGNGRRRGRGGGGRRGDVAVGGDGSSGTNGVVSRGPVTEHEIDPYAIDLDPCDDETSKDAGGGIGANGGGRGTGSASRSAGSEVESRFFVARRSEDLCPAGNVKFHLVEERILVVESHQHPGRSQPLDEGSTLVARVDVDVDGNGDRGDEKEEGAGDGAGEKFLLLGTVFEVFGPVSRPLYTVRLPPPPPTPTASPKSATSSSPGKRGRTKGGRGGVGGGGAPRADETSRVATMMSSKEDGDENRRPKSRSSTAGATSVTGPSDGGSKCEERKVEIGEDDEEVQTESSGEAVRSSLTVVDKVDAMIVDDVTTAESSTEGRGGAGGPIVRDATTTGTTEGDAAEISEVSDSPNHPSGEGTEGEHVDGAVGAHGPLDGTAASGKGCSVPDADEMDVMTTPASGDGPDREGFGDGGAAADDGGSFSGDEGRGAASPTDTAEKPAATMTPTRTLTPREDPWSRGGRCTVLLRENPNAPVSYVRGEAAWIDTDAVIVRSGKGCDASNFYDEELPPHEIDYSDDEKERLAKRTTRKQSNRRPSESNNDSAASPTISPNRGGRQQRQMHRQHAQRNDGPEHRGIATRGVARGGVQNAHRGGGQPLQLYTPQQLPLERHLPDGGGGPSPPITTPPVHWRHNQQQQHQPWNHRGGVPPPPTPPPPPPPPPPPGRAAYTPTQQGQGYHHGDAGTAIQQQLWRPHHMPMDPTLPQPVSRQPTPLPGSYRPHQQLQAMGPSMHAGDPSAPPPPPPPPPQSRPPPIPPLVASSGHLRDPYPNRVPSNDRSFVGPHECQSNGMHQHHLQQQQQEESDTVYYNYSPSIP